MHCCAPGGARIQDDESAALNQQGNSEDVDAEDRPGDTTGDTSPAVMHCELNHPHRQGSISCCLQTIAAAAILPLWLSAASSCYLCIVLLPDCSLTTYRVGAAAICSYWKTV